MIANDIIKLAKYSSKPVKTSLFFTHTENKRCQSASMSSETMVMYMKELGIWCFISETSTITRSHSYTKSGFSKLAKAN